MIKLYSSFKKKNRRDIQRMQIILSMKGSIPEWQFRELSESFLSDIWQSWCNFMRTLILMSVRGCKARDNSKIIKLNRSNYSWQRICYEISQNQKGRPITSNGHNNFKMRFEPTWGDPAVVSKALNFIRPNNQQTLSSGIGSFSNITHMQKVRNACAHKNIECISEIQSYVSTYDFQIGSDPVEIMWSFRRNSNDLAIESWLLSIKEAARLMTESN